MSYNYLMLTTELSALRKSAKTIDVLPEKAQAAVDGYLHISVDGAEAACPYHINPGIRAANRALLGKGSPEEIEQLAAKYFKRYDMRVDGSSETLRAFLLACGIGVDCSGFASWVLSAVTEERLGGPLWQHLVFPGLRRRLVSRLRPIENISANLLTGHMNAAPISDLTAVQPADLIRAASWHHVVLVTEVGRNAAGQATYFRYAQSSCMYGMEGGVRTGYAVITKPKGSLLDQEWFDGFKDNPIVSLIREGGDDSRLVRLKVLA
jgi:hypothetical protein